MNEQSSRSHLILIFDLKISKNGIIRKPRVHFIDLAGSERVKKTQIQTKNRFAEMTSINSSLFVLGRCIDAIVNVG